MTLQPEQPNVRLPVCLAVVPAPSYTAVLAVANISFPHNVTKWKLSVVASLPAVQPPVSTSNFRWSIPQSIQPQLSETKADSSEACPRKNNMWRQTCRICTGTHIETNKYVISLANVTTQLQRSSIFTDILWSCYGKHVNALPKKFPNIANIVRKLINTLTSLPDSSFRVNANNSTSVTFFQAQ